MGSPLRSAVRCTWSIGSSPPRTKMKKSAGKRRALTTTRRDPSRSQKPSPPTSRRVRFTNSSNMSECCPSSMTSW